MLVSQQVGDDFELPSVGVFLVFHIVFLFRLFPTSVLVRLTVMLKVSRQGHAPYAATFCHLSCSCSAHPT